MGSLASLSLSELGTAQPQLVLDFFKSYILVEGDFNHCALFVHNEPVAGNKTCHNVHKISKNGEKDRPWSGPAEEENGPT